MPLAFLLVIALGLYPAAALAVLIHEIGHALFGTLAGYQVTSLGLGIGSPVLRLRVGGVLVYGCREKPLFGSCGVIPGDPVPSSAQETVLLLGGSLLNLAVAAGALALLSPRHPHPLLTLLALTNGLVGTANLFPTRQALRSAGGEVASDGYRALGGAFRRHALPAAPGATLALRALYETIGDTRLLRYRYLEAARAAHDLGDAAQAADYLRAAESLPANGGDPDEAMCRCVRGVLCENRASLERARALFDRAGAAGGVFLCDLALLDTAPTLADALVLCQPLAENPLARRPPLATLLAAAQLSLLLRETTPISDPVLLETLLARYETARARYRADTTDRRVYSGVAAWRARAGDAAGAALATERARKAGAGGETG